MKEKSLETKLHGQPQSICSERGCGSEIFIWHKDGWYCFNCAKIIENKSVHRSIIVKDYGANSRERDKKLKNIVKRILWPECRRSCLISRY